MTTGYQIVAMLEDGQHVTLTNASEGLSYNDALAKAREDTKVYRRIGGKRVLQVHVRNTERGNRTVARFRIYNHPEKGALVHKMPPGAGGG